MSKLKNFETSRGFGYYVLIRVKSEREAIVVYRNYEEEE